jgi:hypothetical protein
MGERDRRSSLSLSLGSSLSEYDRHNPKQASIPSIMPFYTISDKLFEAIKALPPSSAITSEAPRKILDTIAKVGSSSMLTARPEGFEGDRVDFTMMYPRGRKIEDKTVQTPGMDSPMGFTDYLIHIDATLRSTSRSPVCPPARRR